MSASEIIEQIEALPDAEQAVVFEYIAARNRDHSTDSKPEPIEAVTTRIFDRYDEMFRKLAQ